MSDEYPDEFDTTPPDRGWTDDLDVHVVRVNQHDEHDVLVETKHVVVIADTERSTYIISSIVSDPTDLNTGWAQN